MLEKLFGGVFSTAASNIAVGDFLLCLGASLLIGVFVALFFSVGHTSSKSFIVTLALLPSIVCVVIMMVNGNIGAGVAVMGAFSLVRFRSVPGSAKEICAIFMAMAAGLSTGMGYLGYGFLFAAILCLFNYILSKTHFGEEEKNTKDKTMRITIPEDLDYTNIFEDLFDEYTEKKRLVSVKTTNMGSLFKLTYHLTLKEAESEKSFIDALRCRNGNLEITCSIQENTMGEL